MRSATDFLQAFHPEIPWQVLVIHPVQGGEPKAKNYTTNKAEAQADIDRANGEWNLYFSTAELLPQERAKKVGEAGVKSVHWLHVDIDLENSEEREAGLARIKGLLTTNRPGGIPNPSAIIFSGNGCQAFWKLAEPFVVDGDLAKAAEIKAYNLQLARSLGGDSCHNIDRIMRLPFTTNLPDKRKLAKGREPVQATVLSFTKASYPLDRFTPAVDDQKITAAGPALPKHLPRLATINDLDKWEVPNRLKVIATRGRIPDEPKEKDDSRSAWVFDLSCGLVRCGVPDDIIGAVLMDPGFLISESVLEQGNPRKYVKKQIDSARGIISGDFETDAKGNIQKTQHNVRLAIKKLGHSLTHDEFAQRDLLDGEYLDDAAANSVYLEIEQTYRFRVGHQYFLMVMQDEARLNTFHPIRDYLAGLTWDGTPRIDNWLCEYLGVEPSDYVRAVGALVLTAAVRRVRQPGCKFDEMLILEDPTQGSAKSSILAALAGKSQWFSDDLPLNADSKRTMESLAGKWIIEAAELKGMRKGDVDHLKSFLSRQVDRGRPAYGRLVEERARQCVIIGTTNSTTGYLKDSTGNRRFWPVRTGTINLPGLKKDRDQLWAEAAAREATGCSIRLPQELWSAAGEAQEERKTRNQFLDALHDVLQELEGQIASQDCWLILGMPEVGHRRPGANESLYEAMLQLGFKRSRLRKNGQLTYCYCKGDSGLWIELGRDQDSGKILAAVPGAEQAVPPGGNDLPF